MILWGVNALNHGNSLAVFKDGKLISNRSSKEDTLDSNAIFEALHLGSPDRIFWYEQPWLKKARQFKAGQYNRAFDMSVLPRKYLNKIRIHYAPITYTPHHGSHAAAGYYTSPFNHCAVVVLDAIGEFECATIWNCVHGEMKKVWSRSYPNSLGLFYSAFTQALGMTPIRDEWKLQAMAENGNPLFFYYRVKKYFTGLLELNYNFHKGVKDQKFYIDSIEDECNLAAAVQMVFEEQIEMIMNKAKELTNSDCLVWYNTAPTELLGSPGFGSDQIYLNLGSTTVLFALLFIAHPPMYTRQSAFVSSFALFIIISICSSNTI